MNKRSLQAAVAAAVLLTSCTELLGPDSPNPAIIPEGTTLFEIGVVGESFHVAVSDAATVQILEERMAAGDPVSVLIGDLVEGDGGFNAPYGWHLDPESVRAVDVSTEVCDGRPSHVQEDLEYWLETVKQYCPWGVEVVARR